MSESGEGVDFTKREPAQSPEPEPEFDPYRFGAPEHPIPAEFAPPGYKGPTIPTSPYPGAVGPSGQPPYGQPPYGQPPYGQNPYGQNPYGQNPYGQYPGPPGTGDNPPGTPYPPYDYGAPAPPPYHGYQQPAAGNGKAIAGLVFGILSIVLCFLFFFDGIFVLLGLIFSVIALNESRSRGGAGRGMAITGLVCTVIGTLLATLLSVFLIRAVNQCGGFQSDTSSQSFKTCVQDHLFK